MKGVFLSYLLLLSSTSDSPLHGRGLIIACITIENSQNLFTITTVVIDFQIQLDCIDRCQTKPAKVLTSASAPFCYRFHDPIITTRCLD